MKFKEDENVCGEPCFTTELDLDILTTINFLPWYDKGEPVDSSTQFLVEVEKNDSDQNPSQSQINALEYIKSNQSEIIKAMFRYLKDVVYPVFEEMTDIEPEYMIESTNDVGKVLGLKEIVIQTKDRDECAYTTYFFDFAWDVEHKIYLIAHKGRILSWCGHGDLDFACVSRDRLNLSANDDTLLDVEIYDQQNNLIMTKQRTFTEPANTDGLEAGTYKIILRNGDYSIEHYLHKRT